MDKKKENPDIINFEDICVRCGACCGAYDGDPCEHLKKNGDGTYYCEDYENRLGTHYTIHKVKIECVSIKKKLQLDESWIGDELCAYKKLLKK